MSNPEVGLAVIVGLDGSGKSTTARVAAERLSEAYPSKRIKVADSTGLHAYEEGVLKKSYFGKLERLEPCGGVSIMNTCARLGAFTLGRKRVSRQGCRETDLLISVRDPDRIEPATYSAIYANSLAGKISAERRLRFFDRFTRSQYADSIIQLAIDLDPLRDRLLERSAGAELDPHESTEKLEIAAAELPAVVDAYNGLFGTDTYEVQALRPDTIDTVAALIEPQLYEGQRGETGRFEAVSYPLAA